MSVTDQHGRVIGQWSSQSARPTRPLPDAAPTPHPLNNPGPVVHTCAAGIHRVASHGAKCERCEIISAGRRANVARRHITL